VDRQDQDGPTAELKDLMEASGYEAMIKEAGH